MPRRRTLILLGLALLARVALLGWDAGLVSPHPDERQVGFVTERVEGFASDPEFYAYGSLHFLAIRALAAVTGSAAQHSELIHAGRMLSLLASMAALAIGWWVASRAWGRRTADLFAALAVLVPLDLQQSHYATVEAHHAAWVMAALAAAWWLGRTGRGLAAAILGLMVGASLAVKVSSLSLGLVVVVAAAIGAARRPWPGLPRNLLVAATSLVAVFSLFQPTAWIGRQPPLALIAVLGLGAAAWGASERREGRRRVALIVAGSVLAIAAVVAVAAIVAPTVPYGPARGVFSTAERLASPLVPGLADGYLQDLEEQVSMVTGGSDLPYVRVYRSTVPVLYPLRELALWGFGPALLAASIWGCGRGLRVLARRWRRLLIRRWSSGSVLLALLLAWIVPMAVRLATLEVKFLRYWTPLVVPAALVAAWALVRLRPRRRVLVRLAVAGTVAWGAMYLWGFVAPHPHRTAGEWLGLAAADGDVVAYEHWDETLDVDPDDGRVATVQLPSYELPDNDLKIAQMLAVLEQADWVVMTSNRVRKTVLSNPERYPRTGRLYRLLLAGEAGFEIATTASRGPRLLGLRAPVQRADESFLNYEMPRVVILRKVAEVGADALAERLERPLPYLEELDAVGVDRRLVDPAPEIVPVYGPVLQAVSTAQLAVLLLVTGAAAWLLLLPATRGLPDGGVGLAMASGWMLPGWALWMGSELGVLRVGPASASWLVVALVVAAAWVAPSRRALAARIWRRRRRTIVTVLAVGAGVFTLFLVVRLFNPAIFWGEKPMDFSFLNAFLRADRWPTGEPWLAGMPLHYYYFGEVLAATPLLVTLTPPAIGYNLMAAAVPAIAAVVLAGIGAALASRRTRAAGAVLLPGLVLLTGNLAWPNLLELARAHRWFDMWWATSRVIPGFAITEYPLWTALFADLHGHFLALPVLATAFGWALVAVRVPDRRWVVAAAGCGVSVAVLVATNPWDLLVLVGALALGVGVASGRVVRSLLRLAAAAAISVAAAAPFAVELVEGIGAGAGGGRLLFLTASDFAPAWSVLLHFGVLLLPLAVGALLGCRDWKLVVPLAVVGALVGLAFGSGAAAVALAAAVLFLASALRSERPTERLAFALATIAMVGAAGAERFTLIDRMNTIFKIYNGAWVLLAAALAALVLAPGSRRRRVAVLVVWLPLQAVALVNLPLGVLQGWLQPRIASPTPTVDGQAFLRSEQPDEWFATRVVGATARSGEAVAEATGEAYGPYARIAMHTGVTTVVGWPWHLQQRGHPRVETDARNADLATLYGGDDAAERRRILDRYRVGWIVLTGLERRTYELEAEDPFAAVAGVVPFARRDESLVYRVLPRGSGATPVAADRSGSPPAGFRWVGTVAATTKVRLVEGAASAEDGAAVLLWDGSVVRVALDGTVVAGDPPPCGDGVLGGGPSGATVACPGGGLWRQAGAAWVAAGRLPAGATRASIAPDGRWWAWGAGGAWRRSPDGDWRRVAQGPVTAVAVGDGRVAVTDGAVVRAGAEADGLRPVGGPLEGVSRLAWEGPSLWALASDGVHRSGGAVMPWRRTQAELDDVAAVVAVGEGVWLMRSDGGILEAQPPDCRAPWRRWSEGVTGALREPRGVAMADGGWFAVADTHGHGVVTYDLDGTCLERFGGEGVAAGEFREPSGLAVAADGTIAVADTWNGRVQLLSPDGQVVVLGGDLYGPRAVAFGPDGEVLIADTGNKRVVEYSPPEWRRRIVAGFEHPVVGLAWVDDLLAVAIPDGGGVVLMDPRAGTVVRTLDVPGWTGGGQQEGYLVRLPSGDLVATAPGTGGLWRLDPTGARTALQAAPGVFGLTGIDVLPGGRLVAAQTWEHRLVRLAPPR